MTSYAIGRIPSANSNVWLGAYAYKEMVEIRHVNKRGGLPTWDAAFQL